MEAIILVLALLVGSSSEAKQKSFAQVAKSQAQDSITLAPKDNEVCFAPGENCDNKLVRFIQSADSSLDIAIFDLNLDQVVHEIAKAKIQKKKVRVLVDNRQFKSPHSLVSTLIKAGVDVRIGRQRGIMHNKFTIVDGKRLETGSFNYTNGASEKNNENQVYLANPEIVKRFKDRFEEIWNEGKIAKLKGGE